MMTAGPSSRGDVRTLSVRAMRALTATALAGYPLGALMKALSPWDAAALQMGGWALILVALIAAAPILTSQVQRIVGDRPADLDEFELALRQRALSLAYSLFATLVLLALLYAGIASDAGWWLPRGHDAWNGLFWGAVLYAMLIPPTVLAWSRDAASLQ